MIHNQILVTVLIFSNNRITEVVSKKITGWDERLKGQKISPK
jgi:hypothetical protein